MAAAAPCGGAENSVGGGGGPTPLRTFADAGPSDLATDPGSAFTVPAFLPGGLLPDTGDSIPGDYRAPIAVAVATPGGIVPAVGGAGGGLPNTGVLPVTGDSPAESGVPEPSTWALMLAGVGAIGITLRRRRLGRSGRSRTGAALLGLGMDATGLLPFGQLGAAATTAQAGVKSTKAALLAKAALCVCPPAVLATSVAVAPPVRHAVYAATAPRERARPAAALPCGPDVAAAAAAAPKRTARRS